MALAVEKGALVVPPHGSGVIADEPYRFEHHKVNRDNRWGLMARAWNQHRQLHLDSAREHHEIVEHISPGAEVVFVTKGSRSEDIGYAVQRIREVNIDGDEIRVLMIGAKVVLGGSLVLGDKVVPDGFQGKGIGKKLAIDAILRHQPDAVSGRTPNPYAILSYYRTGFIKEVYPIDRLFPSQVKETLAVLLDRTGALNETDLRTGLCRGVYPPGESRLFVLNKANADAVRIYNAMTQPPVDANLNAGDGVRYWARIDKRKLNYIPPVSEVPVSAPVSAPVVIPGK